MNADPSARTSPFTPARVYDEKSWHDRRRLKALKSIREAVPMNRNMLVDIMVNLTYEQTVVMPVFSTKSKATAKETEIATVEELKLKATDNISTALCVEVSGCNDTVR